MKKIYILNGVHDSTSDMLLSLLCWRPVTCSGQLAHGKERSVRSMRTLIHINKENIQVCVLRLLLILKLATEIYNGCVSEEQ
jgi:hypothetical protein